MCFGIVLPEVIALGERVSQVGAAHAVYFVQQARVSQNRLSQLGPVIPTAARNDVVDGGERVRWMVKVSVQHGGQTLAANLLRAFSPQT